MFARQILMKFHRKQSTVLRETSLVSSQFAGPAPRQPSWQADGKVRAWESQSAASQQPWCQLFQAPQLPPELGGELLFHSAEDWNFIFLFESEHTQNLVILHKMEKISCVRFEWDPLFPSQAVASLFNLLHEHCQAEDLVVSLMMTSGGRVEMVLCGAGMCHVLFDKVGAFCVTDQCNRFR